MKKVLLLITVLLMFVLCAVSCGSKNKDDGGDVNGNGSGSGFDQSADYGKATVYHGGMEVTITTLDSHDSEVMIPLKTKLINFGVKVNAGSAFTYDAKNEIIVETCRTELLQRRRISCSTE